MADKEKSRKANKSTPDSVEIPASNISVYEALYRRRMAWRFKDTPVDRETINRILDTAVWAPNHRLTEPWRFFALEKDTEARKQAAEAAYEYSLEGGNRGRAEAARQKVLEPPVLIVVYSKPGDNEGVTRENYASVCCAIQNMSLAAVAEGLTVTWETGRITRSPQLRKILGAKKKWQMVGALSVGVPDEELNPPRTPAAHFTTWL
ncbi:MAG: nitroreductase [Chloroflexota bacterium]|nr:nitroreductase [Chloroflexota bacterium]